MNAHIIAEKNLHAHVDQMCYRSYLSMFMGDERYYLLWNLCTHPRTYDFLRGIVKKKYLNYNKV